MPRQFYPLLLAILVFALPAAGQEYRRTMTVAMGSEISIRNLTGRVSVNTDKAAGAQPSDGEALSSEMTLTASSTQGVAESEVKVAGEKSRATIEIVSSDRRKQINVTLNVPERSRIRIETLAGAVDISGNLESVEVSTDTGTISTDIPDDDIAYEMLWTSSRPRFLADFELSEVKEKSGGKFAIKGRWPSEADRKAADAKPTPTPTPEPAPDVAAGTGETTPTPEKKRKKKERAVDMSRTNVELRFTTARGIVLLNVDATEVSSDLRERPLTAAAKAIVRSGDSLLMEAIRRTSPKYFGDYMRTLPPAKREPFITEKAGLTGISGGAVKTMVVNVMDSNNRAIADLTARDFEIVENGEPREVVAVRNVNAPFNLVLLLDVSGSVDNYVSFIRKAARQFVETMGPQDRISIVTFNDDVHVISKFTTDRQMLSESLDTFDAGGGTAYYDALAYVLSDTLRPLRGDRTGIVVLTDGDDNRSFLPFDSLLGTIQESGALIYPLYVPSTLIAASESTAPDKSIDWLRRKYMGLTTKAEGEGERLARASGGVYYPITQLAQIQTAYDDIAKQLRTAYSVTFRSAVTDSKSASRLRIKVKRENAFVKFGNQ